MRTTLWVTTAAAALIAGTTFAGAQTGKTNEGGASSGSGQKMFRQQLRKRSSPFSACSSQT